MLRGPYKRYEHDPTVPVPKTTSFNRRKRKHEATEATENSLTTCGVCDDDVVCDIYTLFCLLNLIVRVFYWLFLVQFLAC